MDYNTAFCDFDYGFGFYAIGYNIFYNLYKIIYNKIEFFIDVGFNRLNIMH